MKLLAVVVISGAARHEHARVLHRAACAHHMWMRHRRVYGPSVTAGKATKHERSEVSVTTLITERMMSVSGNAYLNGEFPVPGDAEVLENR